MTGRENVCHKLISLSIRVPVIPSSRQAILSNPLKTEVTMKRSKMSRRAFLTTTGAMTAGGGSLTLCGDTNSKVFQTASPQVEDGVVYH